LGFDEEQFMTVVNRIRRSISNRADAVFVRSEFDNFGSSSHVDRALKDLQAAGVLLKLGVGTYAKTKRSVLTGKLIPVKPLEVLAPQALKKLGVDVGPSKLTQAYNEGGAQIPAGIVFSTGKRRISRRLSFNESTVQYERA
jgi:hypothetical protein